jgi:lipoprotein signal peptidase
MLLLIALWVGACDLVVKMIEPTRIGLFHRRTYFELALIVVISAAAVYVVPLACSGSTAAGAGLMVGGGIGNGLSILVFPLGVPNPFVVSEDGWVIAFNLADVFVAIGFVLMTAGVWHQANERRHELRRPVGG